MAEDIGFLDRIKVGSVDERALLAQKQDEAYKGIAAQHRAAGQQASPFVHGVINTVGGFFSKNGRSRAGAAANFREGMQGREDQMTAQAAGIDVETLQRRRKMRDALTKAQVPNDGSFASRIRLAQIAVSEALNIGDMEVFAAANQELQNIRKEEAEFTKLNHENRLSEIQELDEAVVDYWLPGDQQARSGTLGEQTVNGVKTYGMHTSDDAGNYKFLPVGTFSRDDPDNPNEYLARPLNDRIRQHLGTKRFGELQEMITLNQTSLRKSDKLITGVMDMVKAGVAEGAMGGSGRAVTTLDNLVSNIKGFASSFVSPEASNADKAVRPDWQGKDAWYSKAAIANDPIWATINLPQEFRGTSAAAQQHRALVMDMAYMAARLAEPSNRGLSDNDIKNALVRIAGDTTNPQVMIRKFAEFMVESTEELNDRMSQLYGTFQRPDGSLYDNSEIDQAVGGQALGNYKVAWESIKKKHGISVIGPGQVVFQNIVDTDFAPAASTLTDPAFGGGSSSDQSDDDFLNSITGE